MKQQSGLVRKIDNTKAKMILIVFFINLLPKI